MFECRAKYRGKLALSQLLTLHATPVVYLYRDRLQSWLGGGKSEPVVSTEQVRPPAAA